jgi:hypothetical protein
MMMRGFAGFRARAVQRAPCGPASSLDAGDVVDVDVDRTLVGRDPGCSSGRCRRSIQGGGLPSYRPTRRRREMEPWPFRAVVANDRLDRPALVAPEAGDAGTVEHNSFVLRATMPNAGTFWSDSSRCAVTTISSEAGCRRCSLGKDPAAGTPRANSEVDSHHALWLGKCCRTRARQVDGRQHPLAQAIPAPDV